MDYVKSKYQIALHGIDCLWYPAKNPKQLWVLCNGATANRYTMWSWFWDADESWDDVSYLFLKDDQIRWYLGTAEQPLTDTYCAIITEVMQKSHLTSNDVFTIGHSMGGYAALHFGLLLGVKGILALRPQIDWFNGIQFFSIKKLADLWVNINDLILTSAQVPSIYLQFGEFGPDKGAGETCINALLEKEAFMMIEKTLNTSHTGYHPTKDYLVSITNCLAQLNQVTPS